MSPPLGPGSSSETQGQIVGARESLNGRKNKARRKVKNGEKSSSRGSLLFFVPYFCARLDFPSPPLSAPGSPRTVPMNATVSRQKNDL